MSWASILKKKEAKYVPSNDKSDKQDEKFKDFDDKGNPIFLTPAIRVDVKTETYEEEVFKPRKEGPGKKKVTRERKVKSITRDDEKNYFGLTFKQKVKEIKDGKINFVRTLDGKEVQKETYRKYDEGQYDRIQQRYQFLINDDKRNLSEEQIKSLMESFVNQIFFDELDTLPTDTESRKRIKEAQEKTMRDRAESQQEIPEMATGRKEKEEEPKLMEYSILIGKILDEYSDKRELTKKIYKDIVKSRGIYSNIPRDEGELIQDFDMFSVKTLDNLDVYPSLQKRLGAKKELNDAERIASQLISKLSKRYAGGSDGYELLREMHSKIPELSRKKVDDRMKQDILTTMKPVKLTMDELTSNLEKLSNFKYLDNDEGAASLIALKKEVEDETDALEDSDEFVEMEENKRKLKNEKDSLERLSKKHIRYRDMNPEQLDRLRQLKEYDVPSNEEMQQHKKDLEKGRKKINLLRDRISELEPEIRTKTAQLKENKKKLLGFEQQISGVIEGIVDKLDELEADGQLSFDNIKEFKFVKILVPYVALAEELDLYVDKDATDFMAMAQVSVGSELDLDAMLREVKANE
jgi:hypothetical protein